MSQMLESCLSKHRAWFAAYALHYIKTKLQGIAPVGAAAADGILALKQAVKQMAARSSRKSGHRASMLSTCPRSLIAHFV